MVYIAVKSDSTSGGGESLHQLASVLNNNRIQTNIFYFDEPKVEVNCVKFKKYNLLFTKCIDDKEDNCLVVPETATYILNDYHKVKKIIWWLSLDFYLQKARREGRIKRSLYEFHLETINSFAKLKKPRIFFVPYTMVKFIRLLPVQKTDQLLDQDLRKVGYHLYNCEYVRNYLLDSVGIPENNMRYLCGPIDKGIFINNEILKEEKENIVIYNGSKKNIFLIEVLKELKKRLRQEIEIIELKGYDSLQLKKIYKKAKIYIDFGFFPGPERIPREAVINGCNILVGKRGSAKNDIDIPISNEFKVIVKKSNVKKTADRIIQMINDYDKDFHKFDYYRDKVEEQIISFETDCIDIFLNYINSKNK